MKHAPFRSVLVIGCLMAPLTAQVPHFADGTAFGGSKVFSMGLNPLGNPASLALRQPGMSVESGMYFSFVEGGQEAKDFRKSLDGLQASNASRVEEARLLLSEAPWGQKTRSYGVAFLEDKGHLSWTREATTSLETQARPDGLPVGETWMTATRTVVDRLVWGMADAHGYGLQLRVERWNLGHQLYQRLAPGGDVLPFPSLGVDPYAFNTTSAITTAVTLDFGYRGELAQGVQLGFLVDRLVPKRFDQLQERAQGRLGLQIDLGQMARLTLEGDLNAVERMPYALKQRMFAAGLHFQPNPSFSISLGGEQRKLGEGRVNRVGLTVRLHSPAITVGAGFQVGQDKPLRGAFIRVNP